MCSENDCGECSSSLFLNHQNMVVCVKIVMWAGQYFILKWYSGGMEINNTIII
jgi:hypothetical protein